MKLPGLTKAISRLKARATAAILPEYTRSTWLPRTRIGATIAFAALAVFGLCYGATFALVAPLMMVPLLIPLVLALAVIIWALPESRTMPVKSMTVLFFAFLTAQVLWPNYLAISLPGTPWITMNRLIGAPMFLILIYSISTSSMARKILSETELTSNIIRLSFVFFILIQFASLGMSATIGESMNRLVAAQLNSTSILLVAIIVFQKRPARRAFAYFVWSSAIVATLIGIAEWKTRHILWAGHIPSFLHIDDEKLQAYLQGGHRAFTNIYRPQSTSTTSLGFGELLALTAPFVIYFLDAAEAWTTRLLAVASLVVMFFGIYVADARSGMIGFSLGLLSYGLVVGIRLWRTRRESLFGIAISLSYPALLAAAVAASFMFHAIRVKIWGGGAQAGSTEARVTQMHMGLPLIAKNPLGYGIGRSGVVLNYRLPSGQLTVDNYYLTLALDHGVLGLAAFVTFVVAAMALAGRMVLRSKLPSLDNRIYLAIFQSLMAFFIIKSVFSQQDNHPIIFMIVGLLLALLSQEPDIRAAIAGRRKAARKSLGRIGALRQV